jgi:hypothetical protein
VTLLPDSRRSAHVTDIQVHRAPLRDEDWDWSTMGQINCR